MFDNFESHFIKDAAAAGFVKIEPPKAPQGFALRHFFERYGGATFNRGVYRVVTPNAAGLANEFIQTAFPVFAGRAACFASDWLGRIFCLDSNRREDDELAVVMFEPGTGQALDIPANLESFHEDELIHYADAALATNFYQQWLTGGGRVPQVDQCVGYKKPLFLGGVDKAENLEITDLDVYWTISAQLIRKASGLPPGTKIGKVSPR